MDEHLFRLEPGDAGGGGLVGGLRLGTGPDFAAVVLEAHHAVERLHGGMGQVGELEARFELGRRGGEGRGCVALVARHRAGLVQQVQVALAQLGAGRPFGGRFRPIRFAARRAPFSPPRNPLAITATPRGTSTTARTPGTASALSACTFAALAPKLGGRASTAVNRPGSLRSPANWALPLLFALASVRLNCLPMYLKSRAGLSATSCGTGMAAALSASWP